MAFEYKLAVTTGSMYDAWTNDYIYATLIGAHGKSKKTVLNNFGPNFLPGMTTTFTIKTHHSLGELLLLRLEKEKYFFSVKEQWFCSKIVVTTPAGKEILYPCYQWISNGEVVELRGGDAKKVTDDIDCQLLIHHRTEELAKRRKTFQWEPLVKGICHLSNFNDPSQIPDELRFSILRLADLGVAKNIATEVWEWLKPGNEFKDYEDMRPLFRTEMSDYVANHWKDDEFFGYQFLNGINPNVIERCDVLPGNFPVSPEMVKSSLEGKDLQEEMKNGKIFICNQKVLDGIDGRDYNGVKLKMTAGLCLFYLTPRNTLIPIAIQLYQQNPEGNPIFLPTDLKEDWLLAKIFFKNGDIIQHEAIYHLLTTHFLEESFAVATFRNFPAIHPLYKLLIPHFRYTVNINTIGRTLLLGPDGIFSKSTIGADGVETLMANAFTALSYESLCLPDNIGKRGLKDIPNFYYKDDGLKLWKIINIFVEKVVRNYYESDDKVKDDTELQAWISEVFTKCFLEKDGFPKSFAEVKDLVKFITMIIFTSTVQHAAVNNGQADFALFVANAPFVVRRTPPTAKGQSSKNRILATLPNVSEATDFGNLARLLSGKYRDSIFVGENPKERFQEDHVKNYIEQFYDELSRMSDEIKARTYPQIPPYNYLDPAQTENSITI